MRRKRGFCQGDISRSYACSLCRLMPAVDCRQDFFDDLLGPVRSQPIKLGGGQHRRHTWAAVRIVDVQNMFRLIDVRIDIKRWRKPPPVRTKYEAVVA